MCMLSVVSDPCGICSPCFIDVRYREREIERDMEIRERQIEREREKGREGGRGRGREGVRDLSRREYEQEESDRGAFAYRARKRSRRQRGSDREESVRAIAKKARSDCEERFALYDLPPLLLSFTVCMFVITKG